MSLTGRPSSPPLALISSAQICLERRCALPEEARPPVNETLNPILIGSCATAGTVPAHAPTIVAANATQRRRRIAPSGSSFSEFMASLPVDRLLLVVVCCRTPMLRDLGLQFYSLADCAPTRPAACPPRLPTVESTFARGARRD